MENYKCIAIIPARGDSKRLAQKNLFKLLGKPFITYTIETARSWNKFIVSGDTGISKSECRYGSVRCFYSASRGS